MGGDQGGLPLPAGPAGAPVDLHRRPRRDDLRDAPRAVPAARGRAVPPRRRRSSGCCSRYCRSGLIGALTSGWVSGVRGRAILVAVARRRATRTRSGSATVVTDGAGHFRFEGPRQVAYEGRPPHIHLRVVAAEHELLLTRYVPRAGVPSMPRVSRCFRECPLSGGTDRSTFWWGEPSLAELPLTDELRKFLRETAKAPLVALQSAHRVAGGGGGGKKKKKRAELPKLIREWRLAGSPHQNSYSVCPTRIGSGKHRLTLGIDGTPALGT